MNEPAVCPSGHTTNNRVISLFAPVSKSTAGGVATMTIPQTGNGGDACCGGGCSCC
jgi:hypothetical protein